jgi:hypothetical protein
VIGHRAIFIPLIGAVVGFLAGCWINGELMFKRGLA